jgi:hypothetical protein
MRKVLYGGAMSLDGLEAGFRCCHPPPGGRR